MRMTMQGMNVRHPGLLGRPQPPLSGNQLVMLPLPPDGQGLQNAMAADGLGQLVQPLGIKNFPGLGRIGHDGLGRQKNHPSRLHVGFQLLALHCPSSLVLGKGIVLKNFPGLGRIGHDGLGRQKNHPSRLHVGFQLLALHCPSSLVLGKGIVRAFSGKKRRKSKGKLGNDTTGCAAAGDGMGRNH